MKFLGFLGFNSLLGFLVINFIPSWLLYPEWARIHFNSLEGIISMLSPFSVNLFNVVIIKKFPRSLCSYLMVLLPYMKNQHHCLFPYEQEVLGRSLCLGRFKYNNSQHTLFTGWDWTWLPSDPLFILVSFLAFPNLFDAEAYFRFCYKNIHLLIFFNFPLCRWHRNIIQTFMYWQVRSTSFLTKI